MTEPVSLADIKAHLRLDPDETGEDDYLGALLLAARAGVEARIGRLIGDADFTNDDLVQLAHAMRLLVGTWYVTRDAAGTAASELPFAVKWLLDPMRRIPTPSAPA